MPPTERSGVEPAAQSLAPPPEPSLVKSNHPPSGGPPPSTADLVERLAEHRTIGGAPREELAWLAAHGQVRRYHVGEVVAHEAQPVEELFVMLSGRLSIHILRGGTRHKIAEWRGGDVTGLLPYSRLTTPPGSSVVEEASEALVVRREDLPAMIRECHTLTTTLVHVMLDRARFFTSTYLHDEKLISLGKLAAGLAHELNNPAAAITRSAKLVPENLTKAESAARALGAAGLTEAEMDAVHRVRDRCLATVEPVVRSPIEEARREDELTDWLDAHGVDPSAAEALAGTPLTRDGLDGLAGSVRPEVLDRVLRWVAADCLARGLATEIELAATRISDLVAAVRGFTQVDGTAVKQAIDIGEGLAQTLAVMKGKARGKSIRMAVDVGAGLPRVFGFAAELNQIWSNLIDNAIDAAPVSGRVEVAASHNGGSVVVRVTDDGPGIPAAIRDRIFDPFFTTKDVGKGMGLGLDIVRRLVTRHGGDIMVESRPGHTEFIVSLPVADRGPDGGAA